VNFEDIDGFDFSRDDEIFTVSFHRKDFEMKLNSIMKQKEELELNISKLDKIRYSAEFYNLSTEGKERFESDKSYWNEEVDEVKCKIDALVYVTNIFDFVEKLEDMKHRLKELENIQEKLNKIRYSSEYYNLSEDGRGRFDTDSSYWKEELEDTECKVSALIYTIDVFDFVESILDKSDLILSISAL
jgi:hypothetical protein